MGFARVDRVDVVPMAIPGRSRLAGGDEAAPPGGRFCSARIRFRWHQEQSRVLAKSRMMCHSLFVVDGRSLVAERKRAARRDALLAAATTLFGKHGYHATTVPAIVVRAHSSIGAFYKYFENKDDVFEAVLANVDRRIAAALNGAMAHVAPHDVAGQMAAAVRALVAFFASHPADARILIVESAGLSPRLAAARRQIIDSHTRSVAMAIGAIGAATSTLDARIAASCWVGAIHEAVFQWLTAAPEHRPKPDELADAIVQFNLRGVGAMAGSFDQRSRR